MKNLKFSKTSWLILLVGIFVVVIGGLGLTRSQQIRAQDQLGDELSVAETRLDKLQVKDLNLQLEELQARLEQNKVKLLTAKNNLHQTVESIDVTDKFLAMAKSCNVVVMSISSSSIRRAKVEGIDCNGITLSAVAEGTVANLINFIIKLNTDFTTGIVKSAQIVIPEAVAGSVSSIKVLMEIYSL